MSSNHKATLNVQNYCKYVNNFLVNDINDIISINDMIN